MSLEECLHLFPFSGKMPGAKEYSPWKDEDVKLGKEVPLALDNDSHEGFDTTSVIKEKKLLRKLDLKLLPALTSLYLLSFLDRSNGESSCTFSLLELIFDSWERSSRAHD